MCTMPLLRPIDMGAAGGGGGCKDHFFCFHRNLKVVCVGTSWVWHTSLVCMRRGFPAHKGLIVDNAVEMEEFISSC